MFVSLLSLFYNTSIAQGGRIRNQDIERQSVTKAEQNDFSTELGTSFNICLVGYGYWIKLMSNGQKRNFIPFLLAVLP